MHIPQYLKLSEDVYPEGLRAFSAGDSYQMLEHLVANGTDPILVIESDTGDLRDCEIIYNNEAYDQLTFAEECLAVRPTVLREFFSDPNVLRRVYTAVEAGERSSEQHVTRSIGGTLVILQIDVMGLAMGPQGLPRWLVILKDITTETSNGRLHEMLAGARCMVWSALVEELDGDLLWTYRVLNEDTAHTWMPIEIPAGLKFSGAWPRSWLPGEEQRLYATSYAAIWSGSPGYRNELRCRLEDGSVRWVADDVRIDKRGPGRWQLVGVCTDITKSKKTEEALRASEARLSLHVQRTPLAVIEWDSESRVTDWNASAQRMFGHTREEAMGIHVSDLVTANGASPAFRKQWRALMLPGRGEISTENVTRDGRSILCRWYNTPLVDERGEVIGAASLVLDETDRKRTEELLVQESNSLKVLMDNIPDGIFIKDRECRFERLSKHLAAHHLGIDDPATAIGKTEFDFLSKDQAKPGYDDERRIMATGEPVLNKLEQSSGADGSIRWLSTTKAPIFDFDGTVKGTVGISRDVTEQLRAEQERRAAERELHAERERMLKEAIERADLDPLTGLLNHRAFHKRLEEEAERASRQGSPFSVAVLDLDNFKFFNDAYGHTVGDSVLCQVSNALRDCCQSHHVLARFGGDEFALLMPATTADQATRIADQLIACLDGVGYQPPNYHTMIPLTISIGVGTYPDDGVSRLDVLAAADTRLMRAKSGAGGEEILTEGLRMRLSTGFGHFSMLNALVSAVDNKDRYTRRHSEDVLTYSVDIARSLGFDDTALFYIQVAALLHDVGKIGVPDAILRKPGKLTDEEFDAIKLHPLMGAIMVGAVPGFEPILDAVRNHHERWDGKGYPDGLAGLDIPITARLMAVADAFSAMTTDRPYRKGMDPVIALKVLEDGAGTQWDPDCVAPFLEVRRQILRCQGRTDV